MKKIVTALTVILLACGVSYGQEAEPGPSFEHLKSYGPFIGTWRCEGPLLEDVPDFGEKGTQFVFEISWKRVLNKCVVEESWLIKSEGGTEFSGKALIGWNANKKEIAYGGMNSVGGMTLGTETLDKAAKSTTLTAKGIDGEGEETSIKTVTTKTGKDTLTWQALERTGGIVEGPSGVYTFKRVERTKKADQ